MESVVEVKWVLINQCQIPAQHWVPGRQPSKIKKEGQMVGADRKGRDSNRKGRGKVPTVEARQKNCKIWKHYITEIDSGCMKYWNLKFSNETSLSASAQSRENVHKKYNSNQSSRSKNIEIPNGYSRGVTHPCRACSRASIFVHGCGPLCASSGGRNEISTDGLIFLVQIPAETVCQTAQGNMIWACVSVFDRQYLEFASLDISCILNLF